jgi:hypothetical protein
MTSKMRPARGTVLEFNPIFLTASHQGRRFEFLCMIQVKGFANTGDRPFDIDAALE